MNKTRTEQLELTARHRLSRWLDQPYMAIHATKILRKAQLLMKLFDRLRCNPWLNDALIRT